MSCVCRFLYACVLFFTFIPFFITSYTHTFTYILEIGFDTIGSMCISVFFSSQVTPFRTYNIDVKPESTGAAGKNIETENETRSVSLDPAKTPLGVHARIVLSHRINLCAHSLLGAFFTFIRCHVQSWFFIIRYFVVNVVVFVDYFYQT